MLSDQGEALRHAPQLFTASRLNMDASSWRRHDTVQSDSLEQGIETRIAAEGLVERPDANRRKRHAAVLIGALEPLERSVDLAAHDGDPGEGQREHQVAL